MVAAAELETTPSKRYSEFRRVKRKERGGRPLVQQLLALAVGLIAAFALVRWLLPEAPVSGPRSQTSGERGKTAPPQQPEPQNCAPPSEPAAASCR